MATAIMKVHVDQIGPDGFQVDRSLEHAWLCGALAETLYQPEGDGRLVVVLHRVGEAVRVEGRLQVAVQADCSRCGGPAGLKLDVPVEVTLFSAGKEPAAAPDGELEEADLAVATYEDDVIDLAAIVHDEVLLDLPMSRLCSETCAGLCGRCGANLNDGACTCPKGAGVESEPQRAGPWKALESFRKQE